MFSVAEVWSWVGASVECFYPVWSDVMMKCVVKMSSAELFLFLHWLLPNTLNQFSVDRGQKCDGFLLSLTFDPLLSHISPDPRRCFLLFALLSSPSAAEPWETRPCWLMCNHLKGFPLCSAAWLISCASAEGRRVFTHAGRLRASPGGPAEGVVPPKRP